MNTETYFKVANSVNDRELAIGYENLNPSEKLFYCVWQLVCEILNGGIGQYYDNPSGDQATDVIDALEVMGANEHAKLMRSANSLFGEDGPSRNRRTRQKQLDAIGCERSEKMNEIDREFDNLQHQFLMTFVAENINAFHLE
jgi:hypothetical protein